MNYFVDHTVEKVKVQSKRSFIINRTKKAKKRFGAANLVLSFELYVLTVFDVSDIMRLQ